MGERNQCAQCTGPFSLLRIQCIGHARVLGSDEGHGAVPNGTDSANPLNPPPKFSQTNGKTPRTKEEKRELQRSAFLLTHHISDLRPAALDCQHADTDRDSHTTCTTAVVLTKSLSSSWRRWSGAQTTMASGVGEASLLVGGGGKAAVWRERCPGCRQERKVQAIDGIPYADFLYIWIACLCACMNNI